jgi:lipoate-protein ligase A
LGRGQGAERSRYANWEWNYGRNPVANVQRSQRFAGGEVDVRLDIQNNHIVSARIFGDLHLQGDIADLESALTNLRYDAAVIADALASIDVTRYIANVTLAQSCSADCTISKWVI